jgi:hypothetical protein
MYISIVCWLWEFVLGPNLTQAPTYNHCWTHTPHLKLDFRSLKFDIFICG